MSDERLTHHELELSRLIEMLSPKNDRDRNTLRAEKLVILGLLNRRDMPEVLANLTIINAMIIQFMFEDGEAREEVVNALADRTLEAMDGELEHHVTMLKMIMLRKKSEESGLYAAH